MRKRVFDIMICVLLGIPFLTLIFVISILFLVRLEKPFYVQKRLGKNGKPFKIIKFRSMKKNAESILAELLSSDPALKCEWEANFKLKADPRITRIGSFLRKTSLDELPQFFNVMLGHMSWVGPRPIVEEELYKYASNKDVYLQLKPGLTGLWQVSVRNKESYQERVKLDLEYADKQSIFFDISIIFRTVGAVIKGTGQ